MALDRKILLTTVSLQPSLLDYRILQLGQIHRGILEDRRVGEIEVVVDIDMSVLPMIALATCLGISSTRVSLYAPH